MGMVPVNLSKSKIIPAYQRKEVKDNGCDLH